MIEYRIGNILTEDVEAIVNTVNCVGVMGRGIALQFKKSFPDNFVAYSAACKRGEVQLGRMFIYDMGGLTNPRYIVNFPTKHHWRAKSRMEDIDSGLQNLTEEIRKREIQSIAIPPLGSGLGGLEWAEVRQYIKRMFVDMDEVRVIVYEPKLVSDSERIFYSQDHPKMTPGRAALIKLIDDYLSILLDPFITLLEIHKLMYFMQEGGEPLRLRYKKAPYGPYAENLRHVLNAVEGHFITGYVDGGDAPDKPIQIKSGVVEQADDFLSEHTDTKERFERVAELVDGFQSSAGLELLATVHWVMKHEEVSSVDGIIHRVYGWNAHKRRFTHRQIALAANVLKEKNWVKNTISCD